MYVESFHHVLKYIYMQGKVNKQVNKCIYTLLKISRDKAFERLIKLTKIKKTKKMTEIEKRHTTSQEMTPQSVIMTGKKTWDILSSGGEQHYEVTKENEVCPQKCELVCKECNVCVIAVHAKITSSMATCVNTYI